jgi:ankyrin repeat protein
MPQALPANPDLDWLKKAAKKRLAELRVRAPETRLHLAQLAVANDHGFKSWRALKAHVDEINGVTGARERVFAAARAGDVDAVRRAFAAGFDPATQDRDGRTVYQIAKETSHGAIQLLIERGADLDKRDFPDNAAPLHFAVAHADLDAIRLLVEAGADIEGHGDDHAVGVLGWATCFHQVRHDVAAYLLEHGATLNVWTAIALDRPDALRDMIAKDPTLLAARMSRNQHRRTPLHHAAFKNRLRMVQLLLELGADPNAADAPGATALTTAAQERADPAVVSALAAAGAKLDLLGAITMGRFDEAEAMLRDDPSRIGPDGADTIALHLAVGKNDLAALRWLLAHGVAVNAKRMMWDCNHTALHVSVERGAVDIMHLLLQAGADPNIRDDKFGATALGWAEFFGRRELAELIRNNGGSR